MKRNQLIDKLVNEGLSVNTLSKLTDNQINILAERMLGEQPTTPTLNISKDNLPAQNAAKQKKQNFVTYESEQKLDEKLVGKQKNIDKNHNGKIDAQDFKILKGQKTQADEAKPSAGLSKEKKSEVVKKAKKGGDIGKKGKGFEKIADKWVLLILNILEEETQHFNLLKKNIQGISPKDGISYQYYTTSNGILEKYQTGETDYKTDQQLIELLKQKDFGPYGEHQELHTAFLASNHTTGGNSGSPVLDEHGNLMGLNFDRSWESTMSDYLFDPNRCRNIVVDIRYVLWVMDIYSGAKHLVDEMTLIKD